MSPGWLDSGVIPLTTLDARSNFERLVSRLTVERAELQLTLWKPLDLTAAAL